MMAYTHETLFKVLDGNQATHGGTATWTLGEWQPWIDDLVACESGYHLCRGPYQLIEWLGPDIYVAEYQGEIVDDGNKIVVNQARITEHIEMWNERTARLFAADCADHVLHLYEAAYPDDDRPRQAIEVARRYATGKATRDELAAAWDAVWAAARAAARDADRAAVWAAAWAVVKAAVKDAEREWQAERLLQYLNGEAVA